MHRRTLFAAAAAAFATVASFSAASSAHAETAAVQIADLDLNTGEGQAKLESRITRAARQVCADDRTGSRIRSVDTECVGRARAAIEKQVAARRTSTAIGG